jgi:hypothetical protein
MISFLEYVLVHGSEFMEYMNYLYYLKLIIFFKKLFLGNGEEEEFYFLSPEHGLSSGNIVIYKKEQGGFDKVWYNTIFLPYESYFKEKKIDKQIIERAISHWRLFNFNGYDYIQKQLKEDINRFQS